MDMPVTLVPSPLDVRWEVVQKVAGSASFQRSPRLRELLLYICERAIQNRPEELREQQIGCGVFGRRPDYSPGEDNIVRVEIRHLRKRLDEYFTTEGKDEPLVIFIPKGTYVPVFEPRGVVATAPAAEPACSTEVVAAAPKAAEKVARPLWYWIQTGALALLAVACLILLLQNRETGRRLAAAVKMAPERKPLWPLVFNDSHQTFVICADSTLVIAQSVLHRPISLDEYVRGDFRAAAGIPSNPIMPLIYGWQFTDMADVRLVQRLYSLNADHWDKVVLRSAKSTQIQEFKNGNIVLLGSNRSNPWNALFEPTLNFQFDYEEKTGGPFIRNRAPLPGEQIEYRGGGGSNQGMAYSTITLVPNLRHTGNVLIIAGTTGEGTEATGEFITNPKTSSEMLRALMDRNNGRLPYFQVLLKSGTLEGVAKNAEIVAMRILPGEIPAE
jgi:hypothetical protein